MCLHWKYVVKRGDSRLDTKRRYKWMSLLSSKIHLPSVQNAVFCRSLVGIDTVTSSDDVLWVVESQIGWRNGS